MKSRICLAALFISVCGVAVLAQRKPIPAPNSGRALTIVTEPNAIIWLDEIRRGTTDASGKLLLAQVSSSAHLLRVRAGGLKEGAMPVPPPQRGEIRVRLVRTNDDAELTFQQADAARETAKDDQSRQKAADLYRQALRLRPAFPAAHVGLARVLMDLNDSNGPLAEIESSRRDKPLYPQASAAHGRVSRETAPPAQPLASSN